MRKFEFAKAVLLLLLLLMLPTLWGEMKGKFSLPTSAVTPPRPTIILDAGHGGMDGGASGKNGILEKDLNLSIVKLLGDYFRIAGYPVVETRKDDALLAVPGTPHQKRQDLNNRLRLANSTENGVLLSIHQNTHPLPSCRGTQVWHGKEKDSSLLAAAVQEEVQALLQPQNHRKVKEANSSIFLLSHATCPAILVECGFLSNEEECNLLSREEYQKQLALAIFTAIDKKLNPRSCAM